MEYLTSRKNKHICRFRALGAERSLRRESGEFLCDGGKLLDEALAAGAELTGILWGGEPARSVPEGVPAYQAPPELLRWASPLENSPGPLFTVRRRPESEPAAPRRVLVLENVQDPGNVGTVLRTAAAFGADLVALTGECADPCNPKTVRASMGAVFRQPFRELTLEELGERLARWGLPLYGAALAADAADVRSLPLTRCAVAVGNEGQGLSAELLARCAGKLIIPMAPESESLNAAVAASVILWEMCRGQ